MQVITVCGSSRFKDKILEIEEQLTRNGYCVLGKIFNVSGKEFKDNERKYLIESHKKKIELSNAIYVCNIDGYIGEDTKNEIEYAKSLNKEVYYHLKSLYEVIKPNTNSSTMSMK